MDEITVNKIISLGTPKVLLVGDFMLDAYVYGNAERISPEAPVPVLKVVKREYRCGGAASVAAALSALGAKPVCLGVLGDDSRGDRLVAMLQAMGADTTGLLRMEDRSTITKQRLVGLAQHRHQQQLMRVDDESDVPLVAPVMEALVAAYRNRLAEADVVCLQDYGKGVLAKALSQAFIVLAREANKPTLVDPYAAADYDQYRGASLITPNRFEASRAAGFAIDTKEDAGRAAEFFLHAFDFGAVIITLDRDGAFVKAADVAALVPTRAKSVYDVTGAGDVVLAALAVGLAAHWGWLAAAQLANLAAGIAVGKFGTATVTIDEIVHERVLLSMGKAGKVLPLDLLLQVLAWHRSHSETIVFTSGCYDVLQGGHISYLNFCREQGAVVVIGLNSDFSVRQLKGPPYPINTQNDRAAVLAALQAVDYIVLIDDSSVFDLVKAIRPDVLIKGAEPGADSNVVGREFVESCGGKVLIAPFVEESTAATSVEKSLSREARQQL
ncbi:MAG: bifunctional heptose 7-phosphate kinase/heptose 1-phosphate adenyltransferase [Deltaproteobacteria bacterium]|nr:bifunctional heptose 7-phosphate kinase/heptose 1-phosphate adenyltransferase [Deltaproteobacteria bacterium]